MARYGFVVLTTPKAGREQEWDDWHREQHVEAVLDVPGFIGCRRYKAGADASPDQPRFMAIYEIESDDIEATLADMNRPFGTPSMPKTEASDPSKTITWLFEATTRHRGD